MVYFVWALGEAFLADGTFFCVALALLSYEVTAVVAWADLAELNVDSHSSDPDASALDRYFFYLPFFYWFFF